MLRKPIKLKSENLVAMSSYQVEPQASFITIMESLTLAYLAKKWGFQSSHRMTKAEYEKAFEVFKVKAEEIMGKKLADAFISGFNPTKYDKFFTDARYSKYFVNNMIKPDLKKHVESFSDDSQDKTVLTIFNTVKAVISSKSKNKTLIDKIKWFISNSTNIYNPGLKRALRTLDCSTSVFDSYNQDFKNDQKQFKKDMSSFEKKVSKLYLKIQKRELLDVDDVEFIRENDKQLYDEYVKFNRNSLKHAKVFVEDLWEKNKLNKIENVDKVRDLFSTLKIPYPVDNGFTGKLSINDESNAFFNFYTKDNDLLSGQLLGKVVMNKNYDRSALKSGKDGAYCFYETFDKSVKPNKKKAGDEDDDEGNGDEVVTINGKTYMGVYTTKHWQVSCYLLHKKTAEAAKELPKVLDKLKKSSKDMAAVFEKAIKNKKRLFFNGKNNPNEKFILTLVNYIMTITAGRIGNAKSVKEKNRYGIHNLLWKHITKITNDELVLEYKGKKDSNQHHEIKEKEVIDAIKALLHYQYWLKTKTAPKSGVSDNMMIETLKNEYIFRKDKDDAPLPAYDVNKNLKEIGFAETGHKLRKVKAAAILREEMDKINFSTCEHPEREFDRIMGKIAKELGHQDSRQTALTYYTSPLLIGEFFKKARQSNIHAIIPLDVREVLKKYHEGRSEFEMDIDPDSELVNA